MSMLYKYCRLIGINAIKITDLIDMPSASKSTMHKPFTNDEILALWRANHFTATLALIYIYTGLRPQELFEIKRDNVHLVERYMVGGMKTEAGRNRKIPIAAKILPIIKDFYDCGGEYLMSDSRGVRLKYSTCRCRWKGSPVPEVKGHLMHDGRHTCETLLDNAGVNKRTIQLIVGHVGRDIDENVYTHKDFSQMLEAVDKLC